MHGGRNSPLAALLTARKSAEVADASVTKKRRQPRSTKQERAAKKSKFEKNEKIDRKKVNAVPIDDNADVAIFQGKHLPESQQQSFA